MSEVRMQLAFLLAEHPVENTLSQHRKLRFWDYYISLKTEFFSFDLYKCHISIYNSFRCKHCILTALVRDVGM